MSQEINHPNFISISQASLSVDVRIALIKRECTAMVNFQIPEYRTGAAGVHWSSYCHQPLTLWVKMLLGPFSPNLPPYPSSALQFHSAIRDETGSRKHSGIEARGSWSNPQLYHLLSYVTWCPPALSLLLTCSIGIIFPWLSFSVVGPLSVPLMVGFGGLFCLQQVTSGFYCGRDWSQDLGPSQEMLNL